ncbi:hypothetical protein ACTXG5_02000 [Mycobacterium sp. Dal123C01]|uniref:hypothetical protein n=1 Tax=Mycobacterium sp. Dal123C01 TaxID=3457577 RepID=UPI00403E6328
MWVFAVIEAERRLRDVKEQNLTAHLHAAFRKKFDESSDQEKELLRDQHEEWTSVITTGSIWRMTLARYSLLVAAAQLQKCVDQLRNGGADIPELSNESNIKLLRDIDEHWEQVTRGKSRRRLLAMRPDDRPGTVTYGLGRIDIGGGLTSHDIVQWAYLVEQVIREQAGIEGQSLVRPDDSVEYLFESQEPIDF